MLARENALRLAASTQAQYAAVKQDPAGWLGVTDDLQVAVCSEFGVAPEVGMQLLRQAEWIFEGDAEQIIELSLYRKYNRMVDGDLIVGDPAPLATARVHPLSKVRHATPGESVCKAPPLSTHVTRRRAPRMPHVIECIVVVVCVCVGGGAGAGHASVPRPACGPFVHP